MQMNIQTPRNNCKTPYSFLTGILFQPNDGKIKESKTPIKCLLTNRMTKTFMNSKNNLYFENKKWLENRTNREVANRYTTSTYEMNLRPKSSNAMFLNSTKNSNKSAYLKTSTSSKNFSRAISIDNKNKTNSKNNIDCRVNLKFKYDNRETNQLKINSMLEQKLLMKLSQSETENRFLNKSKSKEKLTKRQVFDKIYKENHSNKPKLHEDYGKIPH